MPARMLEPDYADAYETWRTNPTPEANAAILRTLHPVIEGAVKTHIGQVNPLLMSRARRMTLEGLRTYDPARSRLQTHLYNRLQGLKRVNRQQTQMLQVPERILFDRYSLDQTTQAMTHELGREPTDTELMQHTGLSPKRLTRIRSFVPGVAEGTLEGVSGGIYGGVAPQQEASRIWRQIVYDSLPPIDQKIMEYSFGLHGRPPMSNLEIASRLQRTPGAITQRKALIQQKLDQESELSPFQ